MTKGVELVPLDEKKHSWRYQAVGTEADPIVRTIYISKSALPNVRPERIKLTLDWDEAEAATPPTAATS